MCRDKSNDRYDSINDDWGDSCDWYNQGDNSAHCGKFDDEDFSVTIMCCVCKE